MIRCIASASVCRLGDAGRLSPKRRDRTVKVTGMVTLDGQPARGLSVVFHPAKGRPAVGMTDGDGRFSLSTFRQGNGALLGQHVVTVVVPLARRVGANNARGSSNQVFPCAQAVRQPGHLSAESIGQRWREEQLHVQSEP